MTEDELKLRKKLKDDFVFYARKCLRIRTKGGGLTPFVLNKSQLYLHDKIEQQLKSTGKVRVIILKGRQVGGTTYVEGRFFHKGTHEHGKRVYILTHKQDATNYIFNITKRYYENLPSLVRPHISVTNAKELIFDKLDSSYGVGTAGAEGTGRGETIQYLHGSEVPQWKNAAEHAQGLMQAVPNLAGTEIILEGTAKGAGNYFHQQWVAATKGLTDFIPIFIPWFWQDEYMSPCPSGFSLSEEETMIRDMYGLSNEQMQWRRIKINEFSTNFIEGERRFKEEYPCNAEEAFQHASGADSFIPSLVVENARKQPDTLEKIGPLLVGVDPARFGDDRTSIIRRQGRVAFNLQSYRKFDTMEVAGLIYKIIKEEKPDKIYIDVVGIGAGVVDRLNELGYRDLVKPVNAGVTPLDADRYSNKRAEMWGLMREWLEEPPVKIPDNDSLHSDLCAPSYSYDSKHRLVIEKKKSMRTRGVESPDEAEALMLTFAYPFERGRRANLSQFINRPFTL